MISSLLQVVFLLALGVTNSVVHAAETLPLVRIQLGGEPSTLDPAQVMDQYSIGILRNCVEGLYRLDRRGELEKGLVETHTISRDQLTHTFTLKKNAKWSDGVVVRPEDFVFALRRTLDPKQASPNADTLFALENAEDVYAGKKPNSALGVSVEKGSLVIRLGRPDPMLAYELSMPAASPLREEWIQKNQGKWSWSHPTTGDYFISQYKPTDLVELTPNLHKTPRAKSQILYRILPEEMTAGNLFENGGLEVVSTVSINELDRYTKMGVVKTFPATTVFYIGLNHSKAPFDSRDWRAAIASVVDRASLAKLLKGLYEPTESYLPKMLDGFIKNPVARDPEALKRIQGLKDKPRVVMAFGQSAFTKIVTERLQYDLKNKLGLDVELQPMELKSLLGRLKSDPPQMYLLGQSAVYNDSMNQLHAFSSRPEANFSRYSNPAFDDLLDQIRLAPPGPKRRELSEKANRLLIEKDVALVPLVLRMQAFAVKPSLKTFFVSPYQVLPLRDF